MPVSDPHAMTLATARGRRLCKIRHADGRVQDYDNARTDLAAALILELDAVLVLRTLPAQTTREVRA